MCIVELLSREVDFQCSTEDLEAHIREEVARFFWHQRLPWALSSGSPADHHRWETFPTKI